MTVRHYEKTLSNKVRQYEQTLNSKLRKYEVLTPIELVLTLTDSSFKDPYQIRYNKQLLKVLLRSND